MLRFALFLMMLVGVGGLGTVVWLATRPPAAAAPVAQAAPAQVAVLAAAHPLDGGGLLKPDDFATVQVPAGSVPAGSFGADPAVRSNLVGAMVRRPLAKDAVLLATDVLRPGDHGFLAAVLAPGMVATTVSVDAVSGTAGLIWPGDHVDLILTQSHEAAGQSPGRTVSAETVLRDVRAIAVDKQLVHTDPSGLSPAPQTSTVTLEVTSLQAESVAVAARLGHLAVAVRSAELAPARLAAAAAAPAAPAAATGTAMASADPAATAPGAAAGHGDSGVIWGNDVSAAFAGGSKAAPPSNDLRVFEGSGDSKDYHF